MKLNKKKAFTLTELLVVVVVIGVLSAVVLPKFNKVMETRKTTEAEEIMAAVRTEEEKRCALDKRYHTKIDQISELVPDVDTKNFTYALTTTGMTATSKGKYNFTLEMPSYADGRIACVGGDCEKLNKVYPTKEELLDMTDYQAAPAECEGKTCKGDSTRSCGWDNSGTQTRTCIENGEWSEWSTCAISGCNPDEKPQYSTKHVTCKNVHEGGGWRSCNEETHQWYYTGEEDGVPLENKICYTSLDKKFEWVNLGWYTKYCNGDPNCKENAKAEAIQAKCPSDVEACKARYGERCDNPGADVCYWYCTWYQTSDDWSGGTRYKVQIGAHVLRCTADEVRSVWYDNSATISYF